MRCLNAKNTLKFKWSRRMTKCTIDRVQKSPDGGWGVGVGVGGYIWCGFECLNVSGKRWG